MIRKKNTHIEEALNQPSVLTSQTAFVYYQYYYQAYNIIHYQRCSCKFSTCVGLQPFQNGLLNHTCELNDVIYLLDKYDRCKAKEQQSVLFITRIQMLLRAQDSGKPLISRIKETQRSLFSHSDVAVSCIEHLICSLLRDNTFTIMCCTVHFLADMHQITSCCCYQFVCCV